MPIPGAYYRHYKGGIYQVLHVGTHTETEESMVVYVGADGRVWVRPASMWDERVEVDGELVPRFTRSVASLDDPFGGVCP